MACLMKPRKLHGKKYFNALLQEAEGMSEQLRRLLSFNRSPLETLGRIDRTILAILLEQPFCVSAFSGCVPWTAWVRLQH
jgi:hypothetical protein